MFIKLKKPFTLMKAKKVPIQFTKSIKDNSFVTNVGKIHKPIVKY